MEDRKIWFKGAIVPVVDARVSVLSPTAQYGLNVFEGIRCYWSNQQSGQLFAFRLREHLGRLLESCKLIGLTSPYTPRQLQEHLIETVRANQFYDDVAVRMTMFVDGEGSWSSGGPVEMFISPVIKRRSNADSPEGRSACISTWERISDRNLPPRVKAGGNYLNSRYAYLEARRHGYDLPILLGRDGKVTEGSGACLFVLRNGVLITPTLTSSVLESITRATVIQLAEEMKMKVVVREIDRTELYLADELFLCGSAAEITPVTSVDSVPVGCGLPGPKTVSLLRRYLEVASNQVDSYSEWLAPIY